jgi:DNA (cytosine-5)-methyltransferase 1
MKVGKKMKRLKVASLFSGAGGFEYGLDLTDLMYDVVFASELMPKTREAYRLLHGMMPQGDITLIDAKEIPDHDLLIGGFPCQSFSIAGRREGTADTRGTLFFEIERIIKEKKPKFILLENVKGLLSDEKGLTFEIILESLSEVGYRVDFSILNSKKFELPQNRERVYIVATREEKEDIWEKVGDKKIDKIKDNLSKNNKIKTFNFNFPDGTENTIKIIDILEKDVNRKYIMDKPYKIFEDVENKLDLKMVGEIDMKGNQSIRRIYSANGICPTLTTMEGGHRQPKILWENEIRKLSPKECFGVQGFPKESYEILRNNGAKDSLLYKLIGNSVSPQVVAAIFNNWKGLKN